MTPEPWRCWGCGRTVRPLEKCTECGWMVAVHRTRLQLQPPPGRAVDWTDDNRERLTRYLLPRRRSILTGLWRWVRGRP